VLNIGGGWSVDEGHRHPFENQAAAVTKALEEHFATDFASYAIVCLMSGSL
jgi:hypothetical protein